MQTLGVCGTATLIDFQQLKLSNNNAIGALTKSKKTDSAPSLCGIKR
jgi:hypothetical protein